MKKLLWLLLFGVACTAAADKNEPKTVEKQIEKPAKTAATEFSVLDSLKIYGDRDSFEIRVGKPDAALIIGKANGERFAVWAIDDSLTTIFQLVENQWVETQKVDSIWYPSFYNFQDLNGDGFQDIHLQTISGAAGNLIGFVFLFDSASKRFQYNKFFSGLTNCSYVKKGHFIKSFWLGSAISSCPMKFRYKIFGDSLAFGKGVRICSDAETGEFGTLEIFKEVNGKEVVLKRQKGKWEKMKKIFDKTLWDSSNDIF